MIGETLSHYRVLSRLGRKVAIKLLPDEANTNAEAVQRFLREARVRGRCGVRL